MNFMSSFLNSLISPPKLSASEKPELFLGSCFSQDEDDSSPLLRLLSGGRLQALFPYSFDIKALDCFLLLYTKKGCSKLLLGSQVYSLDADSLLLLDCRQHFRIDIAVEPWVYQVLFFTGNSLSYYRRLFPEEPFLITHIFSHSDTAMCIEQLLAQYPGSRLPQKLIISDLLGHILTNCFSALLKKENAADQIPPYIKDIRSLFDNEFKQLYTLDDLEKQFGISKYRLCREFGAAYGMSPLQYLNKRRIDIAKHLLLTTDHKVHVIGSMVGIDNTNHFINLFKKYTDMTPLEYKQRMTF